MVSLKILQLALGGLRYIYDEFILQVQDKRNLSLDSEQWSLRAEATGNFQNAQNFLAFFFQCRK